MQEKIIQLSADQAFTSSLANCKSAEEVVALFEANEVSLSLEEVNALLDAASAPSGGELQEDDLDSVSGGASVFGILRPILLPIIPIMPRIPKKYVR